MREKSQSIEGGCSCGGCITLIGVILTFAGASIGAGCSVRIPLTEFNATSAFSVGHKNTTREALPDYVENHADDTNLVNLDESGTIGPFETIGLCRIGKQPGALPVDLHLELGGYDIIKLRHSKNGG